MPRYDDDDDDDDRPRRSRRRDDDDDYDDRPRSRRSRDDDDYEDRRPSRRRRDDDDDDDYDRPRRRRRREPEGNPAAGTSLTLGLLSILLNVITGIPAIIFGVMGIQKAGRTGDGKGMAVAGIASAVVGCIISGVGIYFFWNMRTERQVENRANNNVRQIGLAFHNHNDAMGRLPAAYTTPPEIRLFNNQPVPMAQRLTSWRTNLLPYVEQDQLFRRYNQREPWNGPTNSTVTSAVVPAYLSGPEQTHQTRFCVFTGMGTPFRHGQPMIAIHGFADGTSNTILMTESAEPRPWGEPADMEVQPFGPMPVLGDPAKPTLLVLMADGSVRVTRKNIDERTLRLLVDPADGQMPPQDW
jgi:hypothetical protein